MKVTKHRRKTESLFNEITLKNLDRSQQFLILTALMNERGKYIKDHSEEGNEKWAELSALIGPILKAM